MARHAPTTFDLEAAAPPGGRRRWLVVLGDGATRNFPLPARGQLSIGRESDNAISIEDPALSRHHATLYVGDRIEIEDVGSANGVRVAGMTIAPAQRHVLALGQIFELGGLMFFVQQDSLVPRARRIWSHTYFEARLEEECSGAAPRFLLMMLRVPENADAKIVGEVLNSVLGPGDLAAVYAASELELLMSGAGAPQGAVVSDALIEELAMRGCPLAQAAFASYPEDGRTPDALLAAARARLGGEGAGGGVAVVVEDPAMKELYRVIERVARGNISVLLLGQTGVGKEVLAEAVHRASPRASGPFVRVNCAALAETLMESELFGHEKGAFTGADSAKRGLLETAHGGTVFLDELGELPLSVQAKLLRAIEGRQVTPVGGTTPRDIDVRFVAATNRDLEREVEAGKFRQDLYYRLNAVVVQVPPLRERKSEIEKLALGFARKSASQLGLAAPPEITARAMELLRDYQWPGNIRELKNVIERAVLLTTTEKIEPEHLPVEKMRSSYLALPEVKEEDGDDEKRRIVRALEEANGNQTKAARQLGIARSTFVAKMDKYGLPRPRKE